MSAAKMPWSVEMTRVECAVELTDEEFKFLDGLDFLGVVQPLLVKAGALQNTVEYNGHLGSVIYFTANSQDDAQRVMVAVQELMRENGLVRDESTAPVPDAGQSSDAAARQETLVVLLVFEQSVQGCIDKVAEIAGHVPKYWDANDEERTLINRLFSSPECGIGGRTVRFTLDVAGDDDQLARWRELAGEMARKVDGKRMQVSESEWVACHTAVGGFRDDVRAAAEQLCADPSEMERRTRALEGLVLGGDKATSLFADWALQEVALADKVSDVDWRAIESRFLLLCEGSGVAKESAIKALIEHSPGATSALRHQSIRDEAAQLFREPFLVGVPAPEMRP